MSYKGYWAAMTQFCQFSDRCKLIGLCVWWRTGWKASQLTKRIGRVVASHFCKATTHETATTDTTAQLLIATRFRLECQGLIDSAQREAGLGSCECLGQASSLGASCTENSFKLRKLTEIESQQGRVSIFVAQRESFMAFAFWSEG
jgi:hypothetical protein